MNSPSPSRPAPSDGSPPAPPGGSAAHAARSDRGAGQALAGFLCALVSVVASLVAEVLASDTSMSGLVPREWRLGPALQRLHYAVVPGATSGEGMLLFTAAFLVALVGFSLSFSGRRSPSRRRLAVSGLLLSALVVVCFCLILVLFYIGWSQAYQHGGLFGDDLWREWATLQQKLAG